jgi:hypothetical protein
MSLKTSTNIAFSHPLTHCNRTGCLAYENATFLVVKIALNAFLTMPLCPMTAIIWLSH